MNIAAEFDWTQELEKTVVKSLATSFGLDFLLFEDNRGGNVDTVHNARQGIYASEAERQKFQKRPEYDSSYYHSNDGYIQRGRSDKMDHQASNLQDSYRQQNMAAHEHRDLDHVISAKEIHNDAGRVLAGLDGSDLANTDGNLASTHRTINRSKQDKSVDDFLVYLQTAIPQQEVKLQKDRERLYKMPRNTPEQQHKYRILEDDIRKDQEKIDTLKSVDAEGMRQKDRNARIGYDGTINQTYYTSSKFLKASAFSAATSGLLMGTRQMLGLIMAEIWFELREQLPIILQKVKSGFKLEVFIDSIVVTLKNIWERICARFNDFLIQFKDGMFAGIMSSLTTTLLNIFATSQKMVVKLIREMWGSLVQVIKIITFNPENLGGVDMMKAVSSILSIGVSTVLGTMIYSALVPVLNFPFGAELAAFIGALATGIIALGFQYFISHSSSMKKVWDFLGKIDHSYTLEQFRAINAKLDIYLEELARIDFNIDPLELEEFSFSLTNQSSELERSIILKREIARRNIELPFEIGNHNSTRKWLSSLAKK